MAGGAVVYLALCLLLKVRPDMLLKMHSPLFVAEIGLLVCIIIATTLRAALLVFPDMYQKRLLIFAPAVTTVFFMAVIWMAWQADNPAAPLPVHSILCTVEIALIALLPAIWMLYSMRGFASTHPYLAGSIALLSAFSTGALSLRLNEPTDSIIHVMQWHYLPMMGVAIIGLWLGKNILKW